MTINESALTKDHMSESIKWIALMGEANRWNLSGEEIATLLGLEGAADYQAILKKAKEGVLVNLPNETIERLSLLLGIWKTS